MKQHLMSVRMASHKIWALTGLAILFFLAPSSAYAADFPVRISAGLGGGFGDNDVGPGLFSGKIWDESWEAGVELYYDGDTADTIDQLVLAWAVYRLYVHEEVGNSLFVGAGLGTLLEKNAFEDSMGVVSVVGWDDEEWGLEFKYGYFDPSLYSFAAYWHF